VEETRRHENPRYGSAHEAVENHAKAIESQHELSLHQTGGLWSHTVQWSPSPPEATRLRPQDVVFKPDRTSLLVETLLSQLKHCPSGRRRKQRNSASQENRHDRHFDAINKAGGKQTPKKFTAAEKSNILARQAPEFGNCTLGVRAYGDVRIVTLSQRAAELTIKLRPDFLGVF